MLKTSSIKATVDKDYNPKCSICCAYMYGYTNFFLHITNLLLNGCLISFESSYMEYPTLRNSSDQGRLLVAAGMQITRY